MQYGELSSAGKDAFRATLESTDGKHVIYGRGDAPEDWQYPTDTGPRRTYVHYEERYYALVTRGTSFEIFDWIPVGGHVAIGLGLAAGGVWWYRRRTPRG